MTKINQKAPALGPSLATVPADIASTKSKREPGYYLVDQAYVENKKLLDPFLKRGRERGEDARQINDNLLARADEIIRLFLLQQKENGSEVIHAEFVVIQADEDCVVGPVAVARNANHQQVFAKRMVVLARLSLHPDIHRGKCYAVSVDNKWGDELALREFGFDLNPVVTLTEKARLIDLIGGEKARITRQDPDKPLLASHATADDDARRNKPALNLKFGGKIDIAPAMSMDVSLTRDQTPNKT